MKKKEIFLTTTITILAIAILFLAGFQTRLNDDSKNVYQVYLNGQKLGVINNQEELLDKINEEQTDIKKQYNVDNVYPPNGFKIEKLKTHDNNITSVSDVYDKVQKNGDFTIKGYAVTITKPASENEEEKKTTLYVLKETIFKDALENVIMAFIDEASFKNYQNNTQDPIDTVGEIIESMYFEENITIKETNISVKEKFFTETSELSKYLLFGKTTTEKSYTVKKGDTISSVAYDNKLNVQEFLFANPKFKNPNSLLAIDETVNVDLISPLVTLVQELHVVEDKEQNYEKKIQEDKSKPNEYKEISQAGVKGIQRMTQQIKRVNGETTQGTVIKSSVPLRETINEITIVGKQYSGVTGSYSDDGNEWGWPTNRPYTITTKFEWRWGSHHNAIDISGPGLNSPIYASKSGKVVEVFTGCPNFGYYRNTCGGTYGNHVIIDHGNNYYTMSAHMTPNIRVTVGQEVKRGEIIGGMASSGSSDGVHLHFGVSKGYPDRGSTYLNPCNLVRCDL